MSRTGRAERQRAAQARAEAARRAAERRRRMWWAGTAVAAVIVVLAAMVVVRLVRTDRPAAAGQPRESTVTVIEPVPAAVLDRIGKGSPQALPQALTGQPALTRDGKPLVVYVGAEYCPFCAALRWPVVVALSRFGTFTGLRTSRSAGDDVYPDTATISFHGSTYESRYLAFDGVETNSNVRQGDGYAPLDKLTAEQQGLLAKFNTAGSIPFLDIGNRYLMSGASFSPELLAGRSTADIEAALSDPDSPIAQAVNGSANSITAALCQVTGGQPGTVCDSPAVQAYEGSR